MNSTYDILYSIYIKCEGFRNIFPVNLILFRNVVKVGWSLLLNVLLLNIGWEVASLELFERGWGENNG